MFLIWPNQFMRRENYSVSFLELFRLDKLTAVGPSDTPACPELVCCIFLGTETVTGLSCSFVSSGSITAMTRKAVRNAENNATDNKIICFFLISVPMIMIKFEACYFKLSFTLTGLAAGICDSIL